MANEKLNIQIMGSKDETFNKLMEVTTRAVKEAGIDASVSSGDDVKEAIEMGLKMPLLVINNRLIMAGEVPELKELKEILTEIKNDPGCLDDDCCGDECDCGCDHDHGEDKDKGCGCGKDCGC
ncbi:MAG: thioredoxin family protein [Candidatus Paceibacterota bacterium]|jgi:hypothetical protein